MAEEVDTESSTTATDKDDQEKRGVSVTRIEMFSKFSSLQDLLDSALGTPEIGAVNFNYLHEVISEILKYLGHNTAKVARKHSSKTLIPRRNSSDTNLPLIRRIEATDDFVQGLADSIKNIYNVIDMLRNESPAAPLESPSESEGHNKALSGLIAKFNSLDDRFSKYATKENLFEFIRSEEVDGIIEERTHALKTEIDTSLLEKNNIVNSLRDTLVARIQCLEDRVKEVIKHGQWNEECLKTKAEVSALDTKCDKTDFDNLKEKVGTQNDHLETEIDQLKESLRLTAEKLAFIKSQNEGFTEQQKKLASTTRKFERDIDTMMDALHHLQTGTSVPNQQPNTGVDEVAITNIRARINDIHSQQCTFQTELENITNENKRKDVLFSDIADEIKKLREIKVDEVVVNTALSTKADKKSLLHTVTMDKLDSYSNELDHRIDNLTQQILGNEAHTGKLINEIMEKFDEKMNRDDLKDIRGYIDERFKNFRPKFPEMQKQNIKATASRFPLQNANCISCDQNVVPKEAESSPLPYFQALPGTKSIRPVTTFELQHIRQHMQQSWLTGNKDRYDLARNKDKLQKELFSLCEVENFSELASQARSCGGGHTSVVQEQRNHGSPPMFYREEYTTFQHTDQQKYETNVMGRDGHVYKGRIQSGRASSGNTIKKGGSRLTPSPTRVRTSKRALHPQRNSKSADSGLVSPTLLQ